MGASAGKAHAFALFGDTWGYIFGKQFMPPWAVCLGRAVVGAVPHLVQLVAAGSAVAQIIQVVVGGVAVVVADLRALRTGSDEYFSHEGVDVARLALALGAKAHKRVSSPFAEARAQYLTLVAADMAV